MSALDTLASQWKAIIGAAVVAAASAAEIAVQDPTTAAAIEAVVPAPLVPFVPVGLLFAGTLAGYLAIYFKKNVPTTESTAAVAVEEPNLDTRMLTIPNSGEFTGAGAQ